MGAGWTRGTDGTCFTLRARWAGLALRTCCTDSAGLALRTCCTLWSCGASFTLFTLWARRSCRANFTLWTSRAGGTYGTFCASRTLTALWSRRTRSASLALDALRSSSADRSSRTRGASLAFDALRSSSASLTLWTRGADRASGARWSNVALNALRAGGSYVALWSCRPRWTLSAGCANCTRGTSCTRSALLTLRPLRSRGAGWSRCTFRPNRPLRPLSSCRRHNDAVTVVLNCDVGALWVRQHLDFCWVNLNDVGAVVRNDATH